MLRLRINLILLLLFTGIALNFERLNFGAKEEIINLDLFVYLLFGAAVISTILLPTQWKLSTGTIIIFWAAIYLIVKVLISYNKPVVGGFYTFISLAEITLLVTFVYLTRNVLEDLRSLEDIVSNITMDDVSDRVKNLEAARSDIEKEFVRSRRYNRPLSVIVIEFKPENVQSNIENLSKEVLQLMMSRYSLSNFLRGLDKGMRRPDLILENYRENRIILLLPEANAEDIKTVFDNIQKIALAKIGSAVALGSAAFPENAVTFDTLVTYAENMIEERSRSDAQSVKNLELNDLQN